MTLVLAAVAGLLFGAGDQYLGSLTAATALGAWTVSVSGLSAPWLVVPFLAGASQDRARRAVAAGVTVTAAALVGYFAMTLSPLEGVHLQTAAVVGLLRSNLPWVLGGAVSGPLYGWLGHRWRTARSRVAAVVTAGALCLEPLAVSLSGRGIGRSGTVWALEVAVGVAAAAWFLRSSRRAGSSRPSRGLNPARSLRSG